MSFSLQYSTSDAQSPRRSKIAIKMSRASDKTKNSEESKDEMDQESLPDEDDMEDGQDTARDATPDLYRNSSLGM